MWGRLRAAAILAATLFLGAQPLSAQGNGALTTTIELEKSAPAGEAPAKIYVDPTVVVPGDRVRIILTFTNRASTPASGVNIVNPIPEGLVFDGTADPAGFAVSVDDAAGFGAIEALTVPVAGGTPRAATSADVTHVRWLWNDAVAPGQSRSVAFFGRVK